MARKINTFPESTARSQTQTLTIPNIKAINSVTVNTGTVSFSLNGSTITFALSNGTVSRTVQTGGSFTPEDTKYISSYAAGTAPTFEDAINLPRTVSYSSGGYYGTLSLNFIEGVGYRYYYAGYVTRPASDTRTYANYYQYTVTVDYVENSVPTILGLAPSDIQSLTDGTNYSIEGTATDPDTGNVLTIKYKINNSPARAVTSGVSDGSSPLSFSKTLMYSNKRLWDGSMDVTGADLAENTDHVLTVWAEDDQGGKSAEVTRKFRVIWNRPPVISGTNTDLGTIKEPPKQMYTVTEPENDTFTITEKINGIVIRSFQGVAGREETASIPHDRWIRLDLDTPHTLTVEAKEAKGLTASRTYTFTRTETHIEFMLDMDSPDVQSHFILDGMPQRVLVTLERYIPEGASIESVKVCNNALDASPTWEDATNAVKSNRGYLFTNKTKTAANWAINIWVLIAKGAATERVKLNGYGGAFD